MNNGIDEVALSGHFSITPRLKATDGMMLNLYLREAENQIASCPWRIAGCGTEVVPREPVTTNDFIDLGGHPKAASRGHLKTGQRSVATFKTGQ